MANQITVDDFSTGFTFAIANAPVTGAQSDAAATGAFVGDRDVYIEQTVAGGDNSQFTAFAGTANLATGGNSQAQVLLQWDAVDATPPAAATFGSGFNAAPAQDFTHGYWANSEGSFNLLYSMTSGSATATINVTTLGGSDSVTQELAAGAGHNMEFTFVSFGGLTYADFDSVTGVELLITATSNDTNIAITEFAVVPEPSTSILAALGAAGLFFRRRKK